MFDLILLPLDSSPESERALDIALDLGRRYHSKLLLLSVIDAGEETPGREAFVEQARERARQLSEAVQQRVQQAGLPLETRVEEGRIAFVICDVADEAGADVIVMGSRGLGLTDEGIQHSTSDRVINLSPCPVLVVP
jgi:nucleotide-binding universal stress UspA family protein